MPTPGTSTSGRCSRTSVLSVDPKITWAKLAAMAEGARLASRELWREQVA